MRAATFASHAVALFVVSSLLAAEVPVSPPRITGAENWQSAPSVASDGDGFLAAWIDTRSASGVYATRITAGGAVLDPLGIAIPGNPQSVQAIWTGRDYAVIYYDPAALAMYAARIGRDGTITQQPHVVAKPAFAAYSRYAATNGSRIAVTYRLPTGGPRCALLDLDTNPIADIELPANVSDTGTPIVASNGSEFLAVWAEAHLPRVDYAGAIVRANGTVDAPARIVYDVGVVGDLTIASDGNTFLLGGARLAQDENLFHTVQVSAAGEVTSTHDNRVGLRAPVSPEIVWTGATYLANFDRVTMHLDRSGAATDAPTPSPFTGALAWNGRDVYIAASAGFTQYDIYGALLPATNPQILSLSATVQYAPDIACGPLNCAVVWIETGGEPLAENPDRRDPWMARITRDGQVIDRQRLATNVSASQPRVVFDGTHYVVAWYQYEPAVQRVRYTRVDAASGALLDANRELPNASYDYSLASNGVETLAVWIDEDHESAVMGARIGADGEIAGAPVVVPGSTPSTSPVAAWGGDQWLVAWRKPIPLPIFVEIPLFRGDIYAARLSAALTPRDTTPIALATTVASEDSPAVAFDGRRFLVTWSELADNEPARIAARHVESDGNAQPRFEIAAALAGLNPPELVWNGMEYVVAWQELTQSGTSLLTSRYVPGGRPSPPILLTQVSPRYSSLLSVALASLGEGRTLSTYGRVSYDASVGGVPRVYVRPLAPAVRPRAARR